MFSSFLFLFILFFFCWWHRATTHTVVVLKPCSPPPPTPNFWMGLFCTNKCLNSFLYCYYKSKSEGTNKLIDGFYHYYYYSNGVFTLYFSFCFYFALLLCFYSHHLHFFPSTTLPLSSATNASLNRRPRPGSAGTCHRELTTK